MFTFTEGRVPASAAGRPKEANPYLETVASVIARRETDTEFAAVFVIPHAIDSAEVKTTRRQLGNAARELGKSGRVKPEEATKGGKAGTLITFWTVPLIARKPSETPAEGLTAA